MKWLTPEMKNSISEIAKTISPLSDGAEMFINVLLFGFIIGMVALVYLGRAYLKNKSKKK